MGMKIKGKLAAQLSIDELAEIAKQRGKIGDKARSELRKRTGAVIAPPAPMGRATKIRAATPAPKEDQEAA